MHPSEEAEQAAGPPGTVVGIFLTDGRGAVPMRAVPRAEAVPGRGLHGDRYFTGTGTWSYEPRYTSEVTLVAVEDVQAASDELAAELSGDLDTALTPAQTRRNIATQGVPLGSLVGRRFFVGDVQLLGERPCHPCRQLGQTIGTDIRHAFRDGRGGLRARILTAGTVRLGDPVSQPISPVDGPAPTPTEAGPHR